jgi:NAD(P)-dependent dehydrogenase (short-subunit alcohol dehydrogenase family)
MTDMLAAIGEDKLAAAAARIPMRRLGQPEELAAAVTFLCTEDASWVTGQTLIVSGGGTVN